MEIRVLLLPRIAYMDPRSVLQVHLLHILTGYFAYHHHCRTQRAPAMDAAQARPGAAA